MQSLQEYNKCGMCHSVSTGYLPVFLGILDAVIITQLNRRFSHVPNFIRGNCFEMGRLNQLNSTVLN